MRCGLCEYWSVKGNCCHLYLDSDDRFGFAYCRKGAEYRRTKFIKMKVCEELSLEAIKEITLRQNFLKELAEGKYARK